MALFLLVFHPYSALTDRGVDKWMIHQRAVIIDHFFEKIIALLYDFHGGIH